MNAPAWPQERLDRWDRITRRLATVGGSLLLAATLLPVPGWDTHGNLRWDWWFVDPAVGTAGDYFFRVARTPVMLLYVVLGLWSVRAVTARPLAARARSLTLPSILLALFVASHGRISPSEPSGVSMEPFWAMFLLPPLGLTLVSSGAARRLGRVLLVFAGAAILALLFFPWDWSLKHLELIFALEESNEFPVAWLRAYLASVVALGLSLLAVGLSRVPNRVLERLTPWIWVASAALTFVVHYLSWVTVREDSIGGGLHLLTVFVLTQALSVGHYTVMGVGLFLWVAVQRRPESDPASWAA